MHTETKPHQGLGQLTSTARRVDREVTRREIDVLRLISEQVAIPLDQLARFLGTDMGRATQIVADLREAGCAEQESFLVGEAPWCWLTNRGARLSGAGFQARRPAVRGLAHRRVLNELRLDLLERAPAGRWICERQVRHLHSRGDCIPDAVFEIEGERHAIEVELSCKTRRKLRAVIAEHSARYDAVIYFCGRYPLELLKSVATEGIWPKLVVRPLPAKARSVDEACWPKGEPMRRRMHSSPDPEAVRALRVLAEQGAIPTDQLARFLGYERDRVEHLVARLREGGFAKHERLLAGEPDWVWLGSRGARVSGTGIVEPQLRIGALPHMRATNEVRLLAAEAC